MSSSLKWVAALVGLAFAGMVPTAEAAITNGSFEERPVPGTALPTTTGVWGGDGSTVITGPENDVSPFHLTHMLRFDDTNLGSPGGVSSDVWQLIDVSSIGGPIIQLTGYFNRVLRSIDTQFTLGVRAFTGAVANFPTDAGSPVDAASMNLFSDNDPTTWEAIVLNFVIPGGTNYIGVNIAAVENVANDTTSPEFRGHYADAISLAVIPVPAALPLMGTGLAVLGTLGWWRRRRRGSNCALPQQAA